MISESLISIKKHCQQLYPASGQWKYSDKDVPPRNLQTFVHQFLVTEGIYTWSVDTWAVGSLMLTLYGNNIFNSQLDRKYYGKFFIQQFGRIPRHIAQQLKWSLPPEYMKANAALRQDLSEAPVSLHAFSYPVRFEQILEKALAIDLRMRARE